MTGTGPLQDPSLRAKMARRLFVAAVRAQRLAAAGDLEIGPDLPDEDAERYAVRLREQLERLGRLQVTPVWAQHRPAEGAPVEAEWTTSRWTDADRVVLHVHGGGYCFGSPRTHRGIGQSLARVARARVVMPAYRLAPEHRFPAALDDVVATYRWLLDDVGVDPRRLAVTGDSAGGGLALALVLVARDEGLPLPACTVGLSPWTDLAGTGETLVTMDGVDPWLRPEMIPLAARGYAGDHDLTDPLVSPLYADFRGFPPMLVHAGSDEVLFDDARRLVERARAAGVEASLGVFDGLWHVFQALPVVPEARWSLREIGAFVRRHTTPRIGADTPDTAEPSGTAAVGAAAAAAGAEAIGA